MDDNAGDTEGQEAGRRIRRQMIANARANLPAEISDYEEISAYTGELIQAAVEILVREGVLPHTISEEESKAIQDVYIELRAAGRFSTPGDLSSALPELVAQFSEVWHVVRKRTHAAQDRLSLRQPARGGAPRLLCNYWAFCETLLGRTPDAGEYRQLYALQKGEGLADPQKSMAAGIKALRQQYKKLQETDS